VRTRSLRLGRIDALGARSDSCAGPYGRDKQARIGEVVEVLGRHLDRHGIERVTVVPVSAYAEYGGPGGSITWDGRWNVDRLGEEIFSCLPDDAVVEAARAFRSTLELRRRVALWIVRAAAAVAFGIGLNPIPISDILLLVPLQVVMVTGVAYLGGRRVASAAGGEWLAALGATGLAGHGLKLAFQQLVKLLPGLGSFLSAGIAGAGTYAIGLSAIAYFIDERSLEEAKRVYEEGRRRSDDGWRPGDDDSDWIARARGLPPGQRRVPSPSPTLLISAPDLGEDGAPPVVDNPHRPPRDHRARSRGATSRGSRKPLKFGDRGTLRGIIEESATSRPLVHRLSWFLLNPANEVVQNALVTPCRTTPFQGVPRRPLPRTRGIET